MSRSDGSEVLRAADVAAYIEALAPLESGVPRDDNGFTYGDPDAEVRGIAVTWMPTAEALREAAGAGLNLLVVHEAWWFAAQRSPWYDELPAWSKPVNLGRLALLTGHGLCLYRCHSNWDARPGDGVADRIGPALGLEREVARGRFTRVFAVPPVSLTSLAERVKDRLGLPAVRYFGDPAQVVRRVAPLIGGFGGNQVSIPEEVHRLGAEAVVAGDLVEYVALHALELGLGVVEALHSATENPALRRLGAWPSCCGSGSPGCRCATWRAAPGATSTPSEAGGPGLVVRLAGMSPALPAYRRTGVKHPSRVAR